MPQKRQRDSGKTLVRGSDGALYVMTKTEPPVKLTEDEMRTVTKKFKNVEEKLAAIIDEEFSDCEPICFWQVRITIPDVFME
jgi:hypothetical protein